MANTHKINVGNIPNKDPNESPTPRWLALRDSPSQTEVTHITEISEVQHFWESENYVSFPNGTELELLEEGLGYKCQWDRVRVGAVEGYVWRGTEFEDSKYIIILRDRDKNPIKKLLNFDCEEDSIIGLPQPQNWTIKTIEKPYYEEATKKWCVSVESLDDPATDMINTVKAGLRIILSINGKDSNNNIVGALVDHYVPRMAIAEDYFIPPNTVQKARVLVTFPKKYLKSISDASKEGVYRQAWNTIVLHPDYQEKILASVSIMSYFAGEIDKIDGTVKDLDLRSEAKRLLQISERIKDLLLANDVEVISTTQIELGLNADGVCNYIAENSLGAYRKLTVGVHNLSMETPFDSPRIMNFLSKLNEIAATKTNPDEKDWDTKVKTWTEYVNNYVDYPKAAIIPSLPKGESFSDITDNSKEDDPYAAYTANTRASNKLDNELKNIYKSLGFKSDPCNDGYSLDYWSEDSKEKIDKDIGKLIHSSAKTLSKATFGFVATEETAKETKEEWNKSSVLSDSWEKVKEEYEEGKERAKKEIADEANKQFDNIKDAVLGDLKPLIEKLTDKKKSDKKTMDTIYKDLLNKICIWDLSIPALACLVPPDANVAGSMDQLKSAMGNFPVAMCKKPGGLGKACVPTIGLPDAFPTEDLIEIIAKIIWDAIISMMMKVLVDMAKRIIELFLSMCDPEPENEKAQQANQAILGLLNLDGIPDGVDISGLLDDIGDSLRPDQLCQLFKGKPTKETVDVVYNIVKAKHPALLSKFKTKTFIIDFFSALGATLDSKMCDDLAELPADAFIPCYDPFEPDSNVEKNLEARGESSTIIEQQLDKARERKREKIEMLSSIIGMMNSALSGESNPFQDLVPPSFMSSLIGQGMVDSSGGSVQYMQNLVLDTMFSSVYSTFNREADRYTNYYITEVEEVTESPLYENALTFELDATGHQVPVSDPSKKVFHSDAQRMITAGVREEDFIAYSEEHGGMVPTSYTVKKINTRLKYLLEEIETSEVFEHGIDGEGFYYTLTLPPDPILAQALEYLRSGPDTNLKDNIDLFLASSNWVIRYKLPFVETDNILINKTGNEALGVIDTYILEVYPKTNVDLSDSDKREKYLAQNKDIMRKKTVIDADSEIKTLVKDIFSMSADTQIEIYKVDKDVYKDTWMPEAETPEVICEDTSPPPQLYLPLPNIYLGEYVGAKFVEDITRVKGIISATISTTRFNALTNNIKKHFAEKIHTEVTRDMFSLIAKQISQSQLFDNNPRENDILGVTRKIYSPEIGKLNLNRTQSPCEKAYNVDPHLLKLNEYKRDLSSFVSKNNCLAEDLLNMNTDGTARAELNSWESAVIKTIIELYIRTFLVDYIMRGVFVLTQFSTGANDYLVDYLLSKIISELDSYGGDFIEDFQKYSNIAYTNMIGTGEIKPEVITGQTEEGLRSIIKKTLVKVYAELKCVVWKDLGLNISLDESKTPKERLIEEWIPLIDPPEEEGGTRFSVKGLKGVDEPLISGEPKTITDYISAYIIEYPRLKLAVIETQRKVDGLYLNLLQYKLELNTAEIEFTEYNLQWWPNWKDDLQANTVLDKILSESGYQAKTGDWYSVIPEGRSMVTRVGDFGPWLMQPITWERAELPKAAGGYGFDRTGFQVHYHGPTDSPHMKAQYPVADIQNSNAFKAAIKHITDEFPDRPAAPLRKYGWKTWENYDTMATEAVVECTLTRLREKHTCGKISEEWLDELMGCGMGPNPICAKDECVEKESFRMPIEIFLDCMDGTYPTADASTHGTDAFVRDYARWPVDAVLGTEDDNLIYRISGNLCEDDDAYCKPRMDSYNKYREAELLVDRTETKLSLAQYAAEEAKINLDSFGLPSNLRYSDYVEFIECGNDPNCTPSDSTALHDRAAEDALVCRRGHPEAEYNKNNPFIPTNASTEDIAAIKADWEIDYSDETSCAGASVNDACGDPTGGGSKYSHWDGQKSEDVYIELSSTCQPKKRISMKSLDISRVLEKLNPLTSITTSTGQYSFDLSNGNFFLERFWKVKRKSAAATKAILDKLCPQIAFGSWGHHPAEIMCPEPQEITDLFTTAWNDNMTSSSAIDTTNKDDDDEGSTIYYNISTFQTEFSSFLGDFQTSLQARIKVAETTWSGSSGGNTGFRQLLMPEMYFDLDNFFEDLEPTLRLIYLPPTIDKQFGDSFIPEDSTSGVSTGISKLIEDSASASPELTKVFEHLGEHEKLYYIEESIKRREFDPALGSPPKAGDLPPGAFGAAETASRRLNIIPLLDTSTDTITPLCDETPDFSTWWEDYKIKTQARRDKWDEAITELGIAEGAKYPYLTHPGYFSAADLAALKKKVFLPGDIQTKAIEFAWANQIGFSLLSHPKRSTGGYGGDYWIRDKPSFDLEAIFSANELKNLSKKLSSSRNMNSKLLFDYIFPVDRHLSMLHIYCMMTSSTMPGIKNAFTGTKDRLWRLTRALNNKGNYQNSGPTNEDLLELVLDIPEKPNKAKCCYTFDGFPKTYDQIMKGDWEWNGRKPENPFADLGFDYIAKALLETGETIYKQVTELTDPNIRTATLIRDGLKAVGMCDPPPLWAISVGLMPPTIFGFPPFGIGFLPMILYPWSFKYLFMFDDRCTIDLNSDVCGPGEKLKAGACVADNKCTEANPSACAAEDTASTPAGAQWEWSATPDERSDLAGIDECRSGDTQKCGYKNTGTQICTYGSWGGCQGAITEEDRAALHPWDPIFYDCSLTDMQYITCLSDTAQYQKQTCQNVPKDVYWNDQKENRPTWVDSGACISELVKDRADQVLYLNNPNIHQTCTPDTLPGFWGYGYDHVTLEWSSTDRSWHQPHGGEYRTWHTGLLDVESAGSCGTGRWCSPKGLWTDGPYPAAASYPLRDEDGYVYRAGSVTSPEDGYDYVCYLAPFEDCYEHEWCSYSTHLGGKATTTAQSPSPGCVNQPNNDAAHNKCRGYSSHQYSAAQPQPHPARIQPPLWIYRYIIIGKGNYFKGQYQSATIYGYEGPFTKAQLLNEIDYHFPFSGGHPEVGDSLRVIDSLEIKVGGDQVWRPAIDDDLFTAAVQAAKDDSSYEPGRAPSPPYGSPYWEKRKNQ